MNDPDVFPLVSEEHAAAIGYVAVRWAEVEVALSFLIAVLLGIEGPAGAALTVGRSSVTVLNTAEVLVRLSGDAKTIAEWDQIKTWHEELRPLRNDAIHAEWSVSGSEHLARREKAQVELKIQISPISTEALNQLADDALELAEGIVKFATAALLRGVPEKVVSARPPGLRPVQPLRPPEPSPSLIPKAKRHQKQSSGEKRRAAYARSGKGQPTS